MLYFKLGLIIGDNLGLHSMLGFVESFNSHYSCRFCKMNKNERAISSVENESLLRNIHTYNNDVKENNVAFTGIKE